MKKSFNVVCVTMRFIDDPHYNKPIIWHWNITGEAILDTDTNTIEFRGKEYPAQYVRGKGLDSMSHMLGIKVSDDYFDLWELYTDTPAEGSRATPEEIRERAILTMARARGR